MLSFSFFELIISCLVNKKKGCLVNKKKKKKLSCIYKSECHSHCHYCVGETMLGNFICVHLDLSELNKIAQIIANSSYYKLKLINYFELIISNFRIINL